LTGKREYDILQRLELVVKKNNRNKKMEAVNMELTRKEVVTKNFFEAILKQTSFQMGEEVFVTISPQKVEIAKNPARALWGSLKSKKSADQLKMEAYEELGDMINAKISG